jgi:hypothetical protein
MNKSDMKMLRAARRDRLVAAGALVDAYKSTTSRTIPSGKVYRRKPKHPNYTG